VFLRPVYVCSCTTLVAEYGFWKTGLLRNGLSGLYSDKWECVSFYTLLFFLEKSSYLFNSRHHQIYYFKFFNFVYLREGALGMAGKPKPDRPTRT
jgi:hypothetical protein